MVPGGWIVNDRMIANANFSVSLQLDVYLLPEKVLFWRIYYDWILALEVVSLFIDFVSHYCLQSFQSLDSFKP